ncbi:MAG: carboxypeptidase regulatory-like domain-containing protein, partial [Bacteroidota bacterium]|nr:carboxypeptidase regulatory-like domain-containing protein [Bacteroidota bacterium]
MTKSALLTLIFLIASKFLLAQTLSGTITGKVTDGGEQKIIDAATVSLLKANDSSLVKIGLTDKNGNFSFDHLSNGKYLLMATSIGHLKVYSPALEITNAETVSAGVLQLKDNLKMLSAVTVAAAIKKPFIERKIDRTVINVDASITNAGTTALEVLEKAPGVTVDKDGNISLKGKQGVMIMMDGKPAYLSGQELANLLKNMPSSAIDQIEIMTNPSAKYDASGNSGVINIKTKKSKMKGLNGSLSSTITQSKFTRTNNSLNLNYRTGKVNLFGNYGYSYWQGYNDLTLQRKFRNVSTKELETIFDQSSLMNHHSTYQNLKAGMDFYAS